MPIIDEPCPSCGTTTAVRVRQAVLWDDRLVWLWSIACTACGYTLEADDGGVPPQGLRDVILEQEGTWEVVVTDESKRIGVALALEEALSLSGPEALRIAKAVPGVVFTGTHAEAEWARRRFARRGVIATCERARGGR